MARRSAPRRGPTHLHSEQATLVEAFAARWDVVDGAVEGCQDPDHPGFGGYLVSDDAYGDSELALEMNPDPFPNTSMMLRRSAESRHDVEVLVEHPKSGFIGGFCGNGLARFHGVLCVLDATYGPDGEPTGLELEVPPTTLEPITQDKPALLPRAGDARAFFRSWCWRGWNALRIRRVGLQPVFTTARTHRGAP